METITAQDVKKFAVRARKINLLNERQKEQKEEIIKAILAGAELPLDGPYVLDLSPVGGKEFSWEDEYEKLLVLRYRNKGQTKVAAQALAEKKMKSMKESAKDKKAVYVGGVSYVGGIKLLPRVNEKDAKAAA